MRARIWRMICSTSTLSERTEKSDIAVVSARRTLPAPRHEFRRLRDAGAEDAERANERLAAGQLDLGRAGAHFRIPVGIRRQPLPVAEQAPPRAFQYVLHH